MKTSDFLKLNIQDLIKGFILITLTTLLSLLLVTFEQGTFPTWPELLATGKVSLLAGAAYLVKNVLTNANDEFLKK